MGFKTSDEVLTTISDDRSSESLSEKNEKDLKSIYNNPRPGYILHSLADISKAKEFDYEPKYSLEQGLKETIKWFGKNHI